MIDLRLGRWQDVLTDVECDALIMDPPYSERVHSANEDVVQIQGRTNLGYEAMTEPKIEECAEFWSPRCRGWWALLTSHDLVESWTAALNRQGRYVFAPLPVVDPGSNFRFLGDGPPSWTSWLVVARPKSREFVGGWNPPGYYRRSEGDQRSTRRGGKPLGVMRAIVRDYSRTGDLVCDPFAGGGTTLLAAAMEGRRAVGAEMDLAAHAEALARWSSGYQTSMWGGAPGSETR